MKNRSTRFALLAALLLGAQTRPAMAAVTFYDDLASFQAAAITTLQSTFESFPPGSVLSPFNDGSVIFDQPPGRVLGFVTPSTSSQINPDAQSNVLATNGNEEIDMTFLGAPPTAVGWDAYTNQFNPPVVTVFDTSGNLIGTHTLTQPPNTLGFVGITSTVPIGRVHWQADRGGIEHTGLDNVRTGTLQAHPITFYLHGNDVPGTADGFTMNQTPGPNQTVALNLLSSPSWFSVPPLTGTFQSGAAFKLVVTKTAGLSLGTTYRLSATNPDGSGEQLLGQTSQLLGLGTQTVTIPVAVPVTLTNQRLKLTISSALGLSVNVRMGSSSFLEATNFIGTP